ncbi:hypothetical protein SAMN04488034_10491 [Salinimicrobium catena]|uniref:Uncharacterized protein n=1 Tax=Salinimicrobium catena TaxID=390640 RepID=A0A1H5NFE8_9FLAO|nr:hypothetical protein [Salinimicrobium catena]SDL43584.1 hypothetical protein SAMN04488140_10491 [Salinimicrobium catena]SEE99601.1 hypothetical protein SAMN04488034_10491 [Salinimicrobium catena]
MFTTGQLIFAILFFIAFVVVIFYSYRKDLKLHRKYYKGTLYVLAGFLLFVALLFVIKTYLKQ